MEKTSNKNPDNNGGLNQIKAGLARFLLPEKYNDYTPGVISQKHLFWYGIALLALKIAIISLIFYLPNTRLFSDINSQELLALINQTRQQNNLPAVSLNSKLDSVAISRANDMIANNYFEHISPSGVTPWYWFKKAGYNFLYAGENLAMDFNESSNVFRAWMQSPSHRENILDPNFREVGLSVKTGQIQNHQATIAVLEFGTQPIVKPTPAKTQTTQPPKPTVKTQPSPSQITTPTPPAATPAQSTAPTPSVVGLTNVARTSPVAPATSATISPSVSPATPETITEQPVFEPSAIGALLIRGRQTAKTLYFYFTLFLILALGINIFVKIRIQRWPTIFATSLMIGLSAVLSLI